MIGWMMPKSAVHFDADSDSKRIMELTGDAVRSAILHVAVQPFPTVASQP
jgi:hypothetical protein